MNRNCHFRAQADAPLDVSGLQRAEVFPPAAGRLRPATVFGHLRHRELVAAKNGHHLLFRESSFHAPRAPKES